MHERRGRNLCREVRGGVERCDGIGMMRAVDEALTHRQMYETAGGAAERNTQFSGHRMRKGMCILRHASLALSTSMRPKQRMQYYMQTDSNETGIAMDKTDDCDGRIDDSGNTPSKL